MQRTQKSQKTSSSQSKKSPQSTPLPVSKQQKRKLTTTTTTTTAPTTKPIIKHHNKNNQSRQFTTTTELITNSSFTLRRTIRAMNTQKFSPLFFVTGPEIDITTIVQQSNPNTTATTIAQDGSTTALPTTTTTTSANQSQSQPQSQSQLNRSAMINKHKDRGPIPFPPLSQFPQTKIFAEDELFKLIGKGDIPDTKKLKRQGIVSTLPHVFTAPAKHLKIQHYPLKHQWNNHVFQNNYPIVLELGCGIGQYVVGLAEYDQMILSSTNITTTPAAAVAAAMGSENITQNNENITQNNDQNIENTQSLPLTTTTTDTTILPYQPKNYIGLEKKGSRLYVGATQTLQRKLQNTAFICGNFDFVGLLFGKGEIDSLWLTFPDQNFHTNQARHITSPHYIPLYHHILKSGGVIHLKTDQIEVFDFTINQIEQYGHKILEVHEDLYSYLDSPEGTSIPSTSILPKISSGDGGLKFINDDYAKTPKEILKIKTFYEELWVGKGKTIKYVKFALNPDLDYTEMLQNARAIRNGGGEHEGDEEEGSNAVEETQESECR